MYCKRHEIGVEFDDEKATISGRISEPWSLVDWASGFLRIFESTQPLFDIERIDNERRIILRRYKSMSDIEWEFAIDTIVASAIYNQRYRTRSHHNFLLRSVIGIRPDGRGFNKKRSVLCKEMKKRLHGFYTPDDVDVSRPIRIARALKGGDIPVSTYRNILGNIQIALDVLNYDEKAKLVEEMYTFGEETLLGIVLKEFPQLYP